MQHTVVLLGSLDTKAAETQFVRERLELGGVDVLVMDIGVLGEAGAHSDISREEVARAGGRELLDLVAEHDRGQALDVMAAGAAALVTDLFREGRIHGALALGGTGGTAVAATAFRDLPVGVPKVIVSTAASGNTEPYIRETDLILIPSIVDIAGLNWISARILANAAAAVVGMVGSGLPERDQNRPLVAATMFGVTTPAVTEAKALLEGLGYEVLVFHMTGSGGRALESLIRQGFFVGVLDITTTELADNLVGGVFDAGDDRLTAAGDTGTPQVVSVGALDMVNFAARETVPERYADRNLYQHNSNVTLMRTTANECAVLGARLASRVVAATGPTAVVLPVRGVSAISTADGPFFDAEADLALFEAIRDGVAGSDVELIELDADINDPTAVAIMVDLLHRLIRDRRKNPAGDLAEQPNR